jgi:hypothetical protein
MRDLIKKILREESEVTEMGLSMDKLKASQPKNYLVRSLKDREKTADLKKQMKSATQKCNTLYSEITQELKKIKWEDIILEEHGGFFYFMLPKKIIDKMFQMCENYDVLEINKSFNGLTSPEKMKQMCSDYNKFIYQPHIYLYLDYPRNRTHFPEGLPKSLLGYNLGVKIYRKILSKAKFIQSERNASKDAQEMYRKLMQMPDVNVVAYPDSVLLIEDGLPKDEVIDILTESIYLYYQMYPNRKLILNRTILISSKLLKLVGESNLLNMMYELFYYSKKTDRDAFKHLGYKIKGKKYEDDYEDDDEDDYDYEDDDDDEDDYDGYGLTGDEEDEDKV